jgi:hypothetical protein
MNKHPVFKIIAITLLTLALISAPQQQATSQVVISEIIKQGVKKVIKAVDLMIQRMQNEIIALQNIQKWLENNLSDLKLSEIAEWTQRQKDLYRDFYDKLWKVRTTIQSYRRVAQMVARQKSMFEQAQFFYSMVSQDKHFTRSEVDFMYRVYMGLLEDSLYNLEQIYMVVNAFKTQMSDAERLEIIDKTADKIEKNYSDLKQFNDQNIQLSMNRAKDAHDMEVTRKLYGLNGPDPLPRRPGGGLGGVGGGFRD